MDYATSVKTARMQAVIDAIDAGASNGVLVIGTASMATTLVSVPLADPCGTAASGVLTFTVPESGTASGTGSAAAAEIRDSDGNVCISGMTVGTSGADVIVSSASISAGDTVTLTVGAITHG